MPGGWRGSQPLFLHIGLPKSGTSFVQSLLADNRLPLKASGTIYPFVRPECMFHAAVEVRRQHEYWGLPHELIDGTWDALLRRVRAFGGAGIISHEVLAAADADQVARVLRDTADLELHVVVTARDLARQVTAHWQESVKNGNPWSFAEFEAELFGPGQAEDNEYGFWRTQDLASVLRRWGDRLPPDRVHVVTLPPQTTDPVLLWRRFAEATRLPTDVLDPHAQPPRNESLGAPQVALLRSVLRALDGRLGQPHYSHVVKRYFAQNQLAAVPSPRPVTPPSLRARLEPIAHGWVEEFRRRGYAVHGELSDLLPAPTPPGARHPDDVSAEEVLAGLPEVLARLLVEIASLRGRADGPGRLPPLPPAPGEGPPGGRSPSGGLPRTLGRA